MYLNSSRISDPNTPKSLWCTSFVNFGKYIFGHLDFCSWYNLRLTLDHSVENAFGYNILFHLQDKTSVLLTAFCPLIIRIFFFINFAVLNNC